jgi:hypothetical protein
MIQTLFFSMKGKKSKTSYPVSESDDWRRRKAQTTKPTKGNVMI